mmetsp:Transcript_91894/g.160728  ORF Transcript_91894/g.160728 Transcript_91894/m.160728 type:complete len:490 (+) Transcript_91894:70-1539(+)
MRPISPDQSGAWDEPRQPGTEGGFGAEVESHPLVQKRPQGGRGGPDDPDTRTIDILRHTLKKLAIVEIPEIQHLPAPPAVPSQGDPTLPRKKKPPLPVHHVGERTSALERMVNSTVGRAVTVLLALAIFNYSCYAMPDWNRPAYWAEGTQRLWMFVAIAGFASMYILPLLAEHAGMSAKETGWKPYFVMFRISFVIAIPAVALQAIGQGGQLGNGEKMASQSVTSLDGSVYWSYFIADNGFVALNLTKGVVQTLTATEHGTEEARRESRFRDAALVINNEPYVDQTQPTEQPGMTAMYRVAPVFQNWAPCVSRYRISGACLQQNPVQAWAIAQTMSLCTEVGFVACRPPQPIIEPVYQCSSDEPIYGVEYKDPVTGLCGRITLPPPPGAIDELRALLLEDGWATKSLPTAENIWLDLRPDPCIGGFAECDATWTNLQLAGVALQLLTCLLMIVPCIMDCVVDYRIREARKFFANSQRKRAQPTPVKAPV